VVVGGWGGWGGGFCVFGGGGGGGGGVFWGGGCVGGGGGGGGFFWHDCSICFFLLLFFGFSPFSDTLSESSPLHFDPSKNPLPCSAPVRGYPHLFKRPHPFSLFRSALGFSFLSKAFTFPPSGQCLANRRTVVSRLFNPFDPVLSLRFFFFFSPPPICRTPLVGDVFRLVWQPLYFRIRPFALFPHVPSSHTGSWRFTQPPPEVFFRRQFLRAARLRPSRFFALFFRSFFDEATSPETCVAFCLKTQAVSFL